MASDSRVSVDLTVENLLPVINSELLRRYVQLAPGLVGGLVRNVKSWAKSSGVCGAKDGFFSSYAWTLLAIFFLQVEGHIPSLQALAPEEDVLQDPVTGRCHDIRMASVQEALAAADLDSSPRSLLSRFFHFYGAGFAQDQTGSQTFCWTRDAVSIRFGKIELQQARAGWSSRRSTTTMADYIYIEDPIDLSHNLATSLRKASWFQTVDALQAQVPRVEAQ
eukprot:TRINITY_DN64242_c0_g1_i1.p1 TRINITY_DN64242_c0_g1~~TRINITY_DN64242_c0_g1_i1.p1  ORF type:complete len:255 (+),score=46.41 TRINITY_DN64242_c0_g1_i1:105-767(+)